MADIFGLLGLRRHPASSDFIKLLEELTDVSSSIEQIPMDITRLRRELEELKDISSSIGHIPMGLTRLQQELEELKDIYSSIEQIPMGLTQLLQELEILGKVLRTLVAQDFLISREAPPAVVRKYRQSCMNATNDMMSVCFDLTHLIKESKRRSSVKLMHDILERARKNIDGAFAHLSFALASASSAANAINTLQQTNAHPRQIPKPTQSSWFSKDWSLVPLLEPSAAFMTSDTSDHAETIKTENFLTALSSERKENRHQKRMHIQTSLHVQSRLFGKIIEHIWEQASRVSTWRLRPHNIVPRDFPAFAMVRENDIVALRKLFQSGQASIYDCTNDGWTLLHTAGYHSRDSVLRFLIQEGTDVNEFNSTKFVQHSISEYLKRSKPNLLRLPTKGTPVKEMSEPNWREQLEEKILENFADMLSHLRRQRLSSSLITDSQSGRASLDQSSTPSMTDGTTEETTSTFEPALHQNVPEYFLPFIKGIYLISVICDSEDIASRKPAQSLLLAAVAENHFANLLVGKGDVSLLCKELLAKVPRQRFVRNFRRLLKSYYLQLARIANSDHKKATILILRKRAARERIARHIAERLQPFTEEAQLRIAKLDQGALNRAQYLEEWIHSSPELFGRADEQTKAPGIAVAHDDTASELSDSDPDDDEHLLSDLPNLRKMEDFLTKGIPFGALLADLQIFTLPASLSSLTRVLMTIPNGDVSFAQHYEASLSDKWKENMERLTGHPWNWWPLLPSRPAIVTGNTRISWKCHCGAMSWKDVPQAVADRYQSLLRLRGDYRRTNHLCLSLRKRRISLRDYLSRCTAFFARPQQKAPFQASGSGSNSQQSASSSTSKTVGAQNVSPTTKSSLPVQNFRSRSTVHNQVSDSVTHTINISSNVDSFVLLGIYRSRHNLEIAHIDTNLTQNDNSFVQTLQKQYRSKRGWLKYRFSIWKLNHFDFVRFEKCYAKRVVSRGSSLPENSEYEYNPRPPSAEMPPITPHEFEIALSACPSGCRFELLHSCKYYSDSDYAIQRIPKKKSEWCINTSVKTRDADIFAWGLETYFVISAPQVVLYNLLILLGPFAFWAFWQGKHPADMQNASIPATFVLGLLALFWTLTGIFEVLSRPVSFS